MTLSPADEWGLVTVCVQFDPVTVFYVASAVAVFAAGYLLWETTPK